MSAKALIESIKDYLTVDLETGGTDPFNSDILCYCFGIDEASTFELKDPQNIKSLLTCPSPKLGHNIKFDLKVLKGHGYEVQPPYEDSFILAQILQKINGKFLDGKKEEFQLKKLYNKIFGTNYPTFRQLLAQYNKNIKKKDWQVSRVPREVLVEYCKNDCRITYQLFKYLLRQATFEDLWIYNNVEMPLLPVVIEMEMRGIKLNLEKLHTIKKELLEELVWWREAIWSLAGEVFNINSSPQLKRIFYEVFDHPVLKKTLKGEISLDDDVLKKLASWDYDLAFFVQGYRNTLKLGAFIENFEKYYDPKTGRIYCTFNQTGTATGRFSCREPNLQQIPPFIRSVMEADEGNIFISADYKQVELRMLAHLAGEEKYIKMFKDGLDPHNEVMKLFGVDRKTAKAINFGIVYGQGAFGLAESAGCSLKEAEMFLERYHQEFPAIRAYGKRLLKEMLLRKEKYVKTILGRIRRFDLQDLWKESKHKKRTLKEKLYRLAINTTVQGSCADIIKLAMINLYKKGIIPSLQVHDELLFEVPVEKKEEYKKVIKETMENAVKISIPLAVDISEGKTWADCDEKNLPNN